MTNNYFLNRYYRYLDRNVEIPDFSKINLKNYDFSIHFEKIPEGVNLKKISPERLAEKLTQEKISVENKWGSLRGKKIFKTRDYIEMDNLEESDYSWTNFDQLAYKYQYYLRKKLNGRISYAERLDMDNIFTKMLSCMIHFYTKKELYHLQTAPASVDIDDYDSVIAMTLIKCLAIHDLSEREVVEKMKLSEEDAGTILANEFGIQPDFWFSSKAALFSIIENKREYMTWTPAPYITRGQVYYPQEIYSDFYEEITKLAKRNNISFSEPRTFGFNRKKAQRFSYYLTGSIDKELYKMYRKQFTVHVPAKHPIPQEVINPINIFAVGEMTNGGAEIDSDYVNKMDAEIIRAVGEDNDPADLFEDNEVSNDLFKKVLAIDNGEILLYKVGIDHINDQFIKNHKRTFKNAAKKYGMSEYEVKKAISKVASAFKEAYPDFLSQYSIA